MKPFALEIVIATGKPCTEKWISELKDKDTKVMTFYAMKDGKDVKTGEITYRRKKSMRGGGARLRRPLTDRDGGDMTGRSKIEEGRNARATGLTD
jgi:hypothetical protein